MESFLKLEDLIKNGKPGYGEFNEFSLYDDWVLLCKDFEHYWTENPPITFRPLKIRKGDIDRATRTATYYAHVVVGEMSKKEERIESILETGLKKVRRRDWDELTVHADSVGSLSHYRYDIEISITDENGKTLVFSKDHEPGGEVWGDFYIFGDIDQDTMKIIDSGKVKIKLSTLAFWYGGNVEEKNWKGKIKWDVKKVVLAEDDRDVIEYSPYLE